MATYRAGRGTRSSYRPELKRQAQLDPSAFFLGGSSTPVDAPFAHRKQKKKRAALRESVILPLSSTRAAFVCLCHP